jgi:hypothetical protein
MHECPSWLTDLKGSSVGQAFEVIGRECQPAQVIVIGRPDWTVFDALVGIPTVRGIRVYNTYPDPSKVVVRWEDVGDVINYPVTRPSRAFSMSEKIRWINPTGEGWSQVCDLVVLSDRDFPFDADTSEYIGDFVHRMAPDAFVNVGSWENDFPPKDFFTVELTHGHCGYHPVHIRDKERFSDATIDDHAGARMKLAKRKGSE